MTSHTQSTELDRGAAVFLDRDGTITQLNGYLTSPEQVLLLPEAAASIRKLRECGFQCVLVTNQSAVGRGLISADQLQEIHQELQRQLAVEGAELDAIYSCHLVPSAEDETIVEHPDRKPGPEMLFRAAQDLKLNLAASWIIGDRLSDVLAGVNAGCRSIRVRTGHRYVCPIRSIGCDYVSKYSIKEAAEFILAESTIQSNFHPQHR